MLNDLCKKWMKSAQNDLIVIQSLIDQIQNPRHRPQEQIMYHSQQAAEKMLKAFLFQQGIAIHGHDLTVLRNKCATYDNAFNQKRMTDHCSFLSGFNIARYIDYTGDVDKITADRAWNSAKRIFDFVSERLGLDKHFFR